MTRIKLVNGANTYLVSLQAQTIAVQVPYVPSLFRFTE